MAALCVIIHVLDHFVAAFFLDHSNEDIAEFFFEGSSHITFLTAEMPSNESSDQKSLVSDKLLILKKIFKAMNTRISLSAIWHSWQQSTIVPDKFVTLVLHLSNPEDMGNTLPVMWHSTGSSIQLIQISEQS